MRALVPTLFESPAMKPLISAVLLLVLAAPGAHAQDNNTAINSYSFLFSARVCGDDCGIAPFFAPADAHDVRPTTQPILDFTHGRRWVHVSGVALAGSQPVPGAKVNVIAELDGGFNKYQLAVADTRGVYNTWFQAPAAISSVTVDVQSFCSTGREADCMTSYNIGIGAGATASGTNSF